MASTLSVMMPYVAVNLLVIAATEWIHPQGVALGVLSKLTLYKMGSPQQQNAQSHSNHKLRQRKGKKGASNLSDMEGMRFIPTDASGLRVRDFFADFSKLVFFLTMVVANLAAFASFSHRHRSSQGGSVLCMVAAVAAGYALMALTRCQLAFLTPLAERQTGLLMGLFSFLAALLMLVLTPTHVLDFEVEAAAADLTAAVKALAAARGVPFPVDRIPTLYLQVVMACGAAVTGALAVAPAIRSVKSYMVATCPPEWAEAHLGQGLGERWHVRAAMHLNMVLPLAVLLLWVRPLMEQPLELGPDTVLHLRVGALLFAGALQALLLRPLVQSYLDSGLIVWYEQLIACEPINGTTAEREQRQRAVALHLELNSTLLCKAAVHALAPAVLLVASAALLWHKGVVCPELTEGVLLPPLLVKALSSFLVWWFCALWMLVSATTLGQYRYGALM